MTKQRVKQEIRFYYYYYYYKFMGANPTHIDAITEDTT